jgi:sec-independent protein translocase protein TatA
MFAAMLGGWEVVLIFAVILILFGAKKLPELARGLGQGIKEFKKATREVTDEIQSAADDTPSPRKLPPTGGPAPTGSTTPPSASDTPKT